MEVQMAREEGWFPVETVVNGDMLAAIWKWGQESLTDVDNWDRSFTTSIERGLNLNTRYRNIPIIFYFSSEEDAIVFKLRWG